MNELAIGRQNLRIVHICLASSFTEGMTYQENMLAAQNRLDGHDVLVIADCTSYSAGKLTTTPSEDKFLLDGTRLVRLPFRGWTFPTDLPRRLKIAPQLPVLLDSFQPDVILHHGIIGFSMLAAAAYKRKFPKTRFYLDSHADFNNSARNLLSRLLQHKLINRLLWERISKEVDKVFYISQESRVFLKDIFSMHESRMEFLPLGGQIPPKKKKEEARATLRTTLGITNNEIVFVHAGKLDHAKRTLDLLNSFSSVRDDSYRLLIIGVFHSEIEKEARQLISADARIKFLGWKTGYELTELLCASDVYVQPGSQSATLQAAICCGLPVIIYPHLSHGPYLDGNGIAVHSQKDLTEGLLSMKPTQVRRAMSEASCEIANRLLDYQSLARRLYV